jgi:hypothetical protein
MRTSFQNLDKRLFRLERLLDPPSPCNCRLITCFHNADCLAAILEKTERKCPVHGFRGMGALFQRPPQYPLVDEDNQFCPCPPHPWRSLQLRRNSATTEDSAVAMQAWHDMPPAPESNFQENSDRTRALWRAYDEERHQWIRKTGRQLPSFEELKKMQAKRYRKSSR